MRMEAIASPVVHLLSASTDLVLRVLGIPSTEPQVTEEEIKVLIEQGTRRERLRKRTRYGGAVFRLGDRPVNALVTPRPDIVWLD